MYQWSWVGASIHVRVLIRAKMIVEKKRRAVKVASTLMQACGAFHDTPRKGPLRHFVLQRKPLLRLHDPSRLSALFALCCPVLHPLDLLLLQYCCSARTLPAHNHDSLR